MPEDPEPGEETEGTWTVPATVKAAEFLVFGASDGSAHGGEVEAALPVTPGETLTLQLGVDGGATSVSRGEEPLVVAAGSNGQQPSFVAPSARNIKNRPVGLPSPPFPQNGSVDITWLQGRGAKGQVPGDCMVPKLRGKTPSEAREELIRHNCRVGSVRRQLARPVNRGRVIGQSPKPGSFLPRKGAVDLKVGRGR